MTLDREVFTAVELDAIRRDLAERGIELASGRVAEAIVIELAADQVTLRLEVTTQLDRRGMKLDGATWAQRVEGLVASALRAVEVYTGWGRR